MRRGDLVRPRAYQVWGGNRDDITAVRSVLNVYADYLEILDAGGPLLIINSMIQHVRVLCPDGILRVVAKDDLEPIQSGYQIPLGEQD
jgi:hypothetical protein